MRKAPLPACYRNYTGENKRGTAASNGSRCPGRVLGTSPHGKMRRP